MKQKIYHARHDENGNLSGGKAGDQGGEVARTDWYLHKKGWWILRAISDSKRLKIAECARKIQRNPRFGYDQRQRNTGWDAFKKAGYDPDKVTGNVEIDCSVLARMVTANAYGEDLVGSVRTDTMPKKFKETKKFELIKDKDICNSPNLLKKGDILVTPEKGHTAIVGEDGGLARKIDAPTLMSYYFNGTFKTVCDLNLRTGAGTDKEKIIVMPKGSYVTSNGCYTVKGEKKWLEVVYDTSNGELFRGFCSMKYLKKEA